MPADPDLLCKVHCRDDVIVAVVARHLRGSSFDGRPYLRRSQSVRTTQTRKQYWQYTEAPDKRPLVSALMDITKCPASRATSRAERRQSLRCGATPTGLPQTV